jgi:carbon monoxide dehydrogenase subunit G
MEFSRTVEIKAPIEDVWALAAEIPAVAACIPGVRDVRMTGAEDFTCLLVQHVGSVKASFALTTRLQADAASRTVVTTSEGRDQALGSTVKATQTFVLAAAGQELTAVDIRAEVQVTGRIATFGHRIIGAKAEQVTVEAIRNVNALLESRRAAQE